MKHFTSVIYSRKKVSLLLLTALHVGMRTTAWEHAIPSLHTAVSSPPKSCLDRVFNFKLDPFATKQF